LWTPNLLGPRAGTALTGTGGGLSRTGTATLQVR